VQAGPREENYGADFPEYAAFKYHSNQSVWAKETTERIKAWGFNTIGGWSDHEVTSRGLPYIEVLHLGSELRAPWNDLFHRDFETGVDRLARERVRPRANDRQLVGWCTDNELNWFPGPLFRYHISQPAARATRQRLIELLREHYDDDFDRLRADFEVVDAGTFQGLARGGRLVRRGGESGWQIIQEFAGLLAHRYYETVHDAVRRYDPNHLILGDRYHGYCPEAVARAAKPFVDVISTNYDRPDYSDGYVAPGYLDRLHDVTQRPVLVTEYYVAARDNRSGNQNTSDIFTIVDTQPERAEAAARRCADLASLPHVVGCHWFQFADEPTRGRYADGEDYNFGLVDLHDEPYGELTRALQSVHRKAPELHAMNGTDKSVDGLHLVPLAPENPQAGLANWPIARAMIVTSTGMPFADLMVVADEKRLYLALWCIRFVDLKFYKEEQPQDRESVEWTIALGNDEPIVVRFGNDEAYTSSDPQLACRITQRGLRFIAIVGLPMPSANSTTELRLESSVRALRRVMDMTWSTRLKLPTFGTGEASSG
jgi:hypothetical protein